MTDWPLSVRLFLTAIVLALTIWAFSEGAMLWAIAGIAATIYVVKRSFLNDI